MELLEMTGKNDALLEAKLPFAFSLRLRASAFQQQ
jgi:hypothetical protein